MCNRLETLDASGCVNLLSIDAHSCPVLEEMDLSGCNNIEYFDVSYTNFLKELDLSGQTHLKKFESDISTLEILDLSGCSALTEVDCIRSRLTSIKLDDCSNLETLKVNGNNLSFLDLRDCGNLKTLDVRDNKLRELTLYSELSRIYAGEQHPDKTFKAYRAENRSNGNGHIYCIVDLWSVSGEGAAISYATMSNAGVDNSSNPRFVLLDYSNYLERESYRKTVGYAVTVQDLGNYQMEVYAGIELEEMPFVTGLDTEYVILGADVYCAYNLRVLTTGGVLSESFTTEWSSSDTSVATVDQAGTVTGVGKGTAEITATVKIGAGSILATAKCRVDCVDSIVPNNVTGVVLAEKKVTLELFRTDYPEIEVLPILAQNQFNTAASVLPETELPENLNRGISIFDAKFTDENGEENKAYEYLKLEIVNDRTLRIVPDYDKMKAAFEDPKNHKFPSSFKSAITVKVGRVDDLYNIKTITTGLLTITVKQSKPSVKAGAVKLNSSSYLFNSTVPLSLTGNGIKSIRVNGAAPAWVKVNLNERTVAYTGTGDAKKSGTLDLLCTLEGWMVQAPVTVKITAAPTAPVVKLSAKSVTLSGGTDDTVRVGYTLNPGFEDLRFRFLRITEVIGKTREDIRNGSVLCVSNATAGSLEFSLKSTEEEFDGKPHTYEVYFELGGKEYTVTVKVTDSAKTKVTMSFKSAGTLDLGIKSSGLVLTPVVKNYSDYENGDYTLERIYRADNPGTDVKSDFNFVSHLTYDGNFVLSPIYRATEPHFGSLRAGKYVAEIKLDLGNEKTVISKVNFTLKNTPETAFNPTATLKVSGYIDPLRESTQAVIKYTVKGIDAAEVSKQMEYPDLNLYYKRGTDYIHLDQLYHAYKDGYFIVSISNYYPEAVLGRKIFARLEFEFKNYDGNTITVYSGYVPIPVKTEKVKLEPSSATGSLSAKDCNDGMLLTVKPVGVEVDSQLAVDKIVLDAKSAGLFKIEKVYGDGDIIDYNDYTWRLSWKDKDISIPKPGSTVSVTLNVYVLGNTTGKPDATMTVKVKVTG